MKPLLFRAAVGQLTSGKVFDTDYASHRTLSRRFYFKPNGDFLGEISSGELRDFSLKSASNSTQDLWLCSAWRESIDESKLFVIDYAFHWGPPRWLYFNISAFDPGQICSGELRKKRTFWKRVHWAKVACNHPTAWGCLLSFVHLDERFLVEKKWPPLPTIPGRYDLGNKEKGKQRFSSMLFFSHFLPLKYHIFARSTPFKVIFSVV